MRAGRLRHVATIEHKVNVKGSMGGTTTTWQAFASVRVDIVPISGREKLATNMAHRPIPQR